MTSIKDILSFSVRDWSSYFYRPKWFWAIGIFVFLLISYFYNYQEILFAQPQSLHLWRQADCLSFATNFYVDQNPFFQPSIHNLAGDGTGKTVSDFPLLYYVVAQLWKWFGHHEFIYRLTVLTLFFAAFMFLYKTGEQMFRDSFLGLSGAVLLFSSPVIVYYANNFLMNLPALSLALVGLYFFYRYYQSSRFIFFIFFTLLFAISGLLKITSLLTFIAIGCLFVLEVLGVRFRKGSKVFSTPIKCGLAMVLVLLVQVLWYRYAIEYNREYNSGFFLIGTKPIWDMEMAKIQETISEVKYHLRWHYFRPFTHYALTAVCLLVFLFWRKNNKFFISFLFLTILGFIGFLALFFAVIGDHDYYVINFFIIAPIVVYAFYFGIKRVFPDFYKTLLFRALVLAFLIHNVDFARRRIEDRYNPDRWENISYIRHMKTFSDVSPYLDSLGIQPEDRIISLDDPTINISLYFMGRKGWTRFNTKEDTNQINKNIRLGAKYLVCSSAQSEHRNIKHYKKIGSFKHLVIFALPDKESL
jgi:hypothetical protein